MNDTDIGISGLALYVPPFRVKLEDWSGWTGNSWDKTRAVIGNSFRICGTQHSVYTMAANAVLKLILDYGIDPQRVGYLALGTESSTDNCAGAVIVRGLVDAGLRARGLPRLARDCEVPEFKQACLAGIYGLKGALRYVAYDGHDRQAIVVAADIAEYARGSTGEPTQGAGACAMLVERAPKMLALDLMRAGSASDYRIADFRKPFLRFCAQTPGVGNARLRDFPMFNGKYSTACYVDETLHALESLFGKRGSGNRADYLRSIEAVFMHRPYHKMPVTGWATGYLYALAADNGKELDELRGYCERASVNLDHLRLELQSHPDLTAHADAGQFPEEAYPLCAQVMKAFRESPNYRRIVDDKMRLGAKVMMEMGNLYSAALPAWIAAGLEEAAEKGVNLSGKPILLIGYGSGDAAEAIPARVVDGWAALAPRIGTSRVLAEAIDLTQAQYAALHDGHAVPELQAPEASGFFVSSVGTHDDAKFHDFGVEYYRFS